MERVDVTVTGGCQCGAVRYRATAMLDNAHLCHCRMCQKAMGNIFAALVAAPNDALEWPRGTPAAFRSSEHVDRGFCAACGTPLYYRNLQGSRTNLTIGSLDHPAAFPPRTQMGSEARMPWFDLPGLEDEGETGAGDAANWAAAIAATNRQAPDGIDPSHRPDQHIPHRHHGADQHQHALLPLTAADHLYATPQQYERAEHQRGECGRGTGRKFGSHGFAMPEAAMKVEG